VSRAAVVAAAVVGLLTVPTVSLSSWFATLETADASPEGRHRWRNAPAMVAAVKALPEHARPSRFLYLASGAHLAPLALCELIPDDRPCELVFTEVDPEVGRRIHVALTAAAQAGRLTELVSPAAPVDPPSRSWGFSADGRVVRLELRVRPEADSLVAADDLRDTDLVINHDWSGDPLGNLRVIDEFLYAVHSAGLETPPMLMIEDLEAHPFPVPLGLFSPVTRGNGDYGHRTSDEGVGLHGTVELGPALFGGAVILDFSDAWWRNLDTDRRRAVLDLLLLAGCDDRRRNVLEGGSVAMVPPLVLDWWTGFGERTVSTDELNASPEPRLRAITAAAALRSDSTPERNAHLNRALSTYRALLEALAAGAHTDSLWPYHADFRTLEPSAFPTDAMRQAHREALRHIREFRPAREHSLQVAAPPSRRCRCSTRRSRTLARNRQRTRPTRKPRGRITTGASWRRNPADQAAAAVRLAAFLIPCHPERACESRGPPLEATGPHSTRHPDAGPATASGHGHRTRCRSRTEPSLSMTAFSVRDSGGGRGSEQHPTE
jgi:hypothetical protein